ncbi:hypothetical protein BD560DRAFT_427051 [Blakeslea trispora]|nr:hypothetical protein BD560DRAFT_427051 [Blakeslea trispora]
MSDTHDPKAWFKKLKPITDQIQTIEITPSNQKQASQLLVQLRTLLESIDDPEQGLTSVNVHSILLPLLKLFKSNAQHGYETIIEPWLDIMHFLLSKTLIRAWLTPAFTMELIALFTQLIQPSSEAIKQKAIGCLSATLPGQYKEGRFIDQSIYAHLITMLQQQLHLASHTIMTLLEFIQQEHQVDLRLLAIRTLSQLLLDNLYQPDILAGLLPGIVSKLCAAIRKRQEKENHKVTCELLALLGQLIHHVMADDQNLTLVEMRSFHDLLSSPAEIKSSVRDTAWYALSKERMLPILSQILRSDIIYTHWQSRLAFVEFAYTLLFYCARTLDNLIKPLTEMLAVHLDDPFDQVATTCQLRVQVLMSNPSFETAIVPVLKDDLYDWMQRLPHIILTKAEQEKQMAMSMITGLLILLAEQSHSVLGFSLARISDGWMTALAIDQDSLKILQDQQTHPSITFDHQQAVKAMYPRIRLKHVVSDDAMLQAVRMLNTIGQYGDVSLWVQHFMRYLSPESNDPQAAFIIHALLAGAFAEHPSLDDTHPKDTHLALRVMGDTMNILKDAIDIRFKNRSTRTLATLEMVEQEASAVLLVCLSLQMVGLCCSLLSQEQLQEQLITLLYPLLSHLGSSHRSIHTYALITLDCIALQCGIEGGARELAIANIDYVINTISQHITMLTQHVRVLFVLKALVQIGGRKSIDYLEDSVDELFDALERYSDYEWLSMQLCSILFDIVQTLEKEYPFKAKQEHVVEPSTSDPTVSAEVKAWIEQQTHSATIEDEHTSMEAIGQYFLDRQKQGLHDNLTLAQTMEQGHLPIAEDNPQEDSEQVESKEIPLNHEQKMTLNIMTTSSHFLTSSLPQLRAQVLGLLSQGCRILAEHPNRLNPLIHSMWSSIVYRFRDTHNYVVYAAAQLLETLSQVSTDFLSSRFIKDVWPQLQHVLQQSVAAAKSESTGYSVYSVYHRTQICLLSTLTQVGYHVPLPQPLIKSILEATQFYYHSELVHPQLNQACHTLFDALETQQPDTLLDLSMPFCRCGEVCYGVQCKKCGFKFNEKRKRLELKFPKETSQATSGETPMIVVDRWQSRQPIIKDHRYLGSVIGLDSLSKKASELSKATLPKTSLDYGLLDSRKVRSSQSMTLQSASSTKAECGLCQKKLSGKTVRLPDGSVKYHWHCLQCKGCGLPFEDPSFYIDPSKHIYHPQCAPSIQTCSRCSQAIADTYLHYNTHILHPRCFRCTGCQKILHPTSIYTDFQGPYCQTCTNETLDQDKQVLSDHLKIVPSPISTSTKHHDITSPITPLSPLAQIPENVKPSTLMSSRGRPLPKFGLVRDCAGCHERIVSVHEEIPGPKASKWHKKCLVCQGCLKSLDSGASVDEEEGKLKPWCTTCLLTRKKRMTTSLSQRLTTLKIN